MFYFGFTEKYDHIGKLLKPGEKPTDYSDTEEEQSSHEKSKDDWTWINSYASSPRGGCYR